MQREVRFRLRHSAIRSKNKARTRERSFPPPQSARRSFAPFAFHHTRPQRSPREPRVAILLGTYHGQRYLAEQLESFTAQTHRNWTVWASDDGSEDDTRAILTQYQHKWGKHRLSIHFGPCEGFVANYLSLTCDPSIDADYYAYSDQDDIWESDKLARALQFLRGIPANVPALYCSRTRLVDAHNRDIGLSPLFTRPPSFANALMQSIGGGNTIVYNHAARALLQEAGNAVDVASHDWWAYMVVSGCGGRVVYDAYPSLRYRQHEANLVGMNSTWPARLGRMRQLWQGRFKGWNSRHIRALNGLRDKLTEGNRAVLDQFMASRHKSLVPRLLGLMRAGLYRQTLMGNLGLIAAGIFRKM